jgi:hypothetical protein
MRRYLVIAALFALAAGLLVWPATAMAQAERSEYHGVVCPDFSVQGEIVRQWESGDVLHVRSTGGRGLIPASAPRAGGTLIQENFDYELNLKTGSGNFRAKFTFVPDDPSIGGEWKAQGGGRFRDFVITDFHGVAHGTGSLAGLKMVYKGQLATGSVEGRPRLTEPWFC